MQFNKYTHTHVGKAIGTLREILPQQSIATCIIVYLMLSEEFTVTAEEAGSKSGRCLPSGVMARVDTVIIVEVEVLLYYNHSRTVGYARRAIHHGTMMQSHLAVHVL